MIDVGVIFRDPTEFTMPTIGSDVPGDWNGYWHFKNTSGSIDQFGMESTLTFKSQKVLANISHSLVSVVSSSDQQRGSMYLNDHNNFKAYPHHVTRFNAIYSITSRLSTGLNYLYYYKWYSPNNQSVPGNHMLNLSTRYEINDNMKISINGLNILGEDHLYPMNNNVDEPTLSDGAPALEKTSFLATLTFDF